MYTPINNWKEGNLSKIPLTFASLVKSEAPHPAHKNTPARFSFSRGLVKDFSVAPCLNTAY
jgi:hypothetical protein